MQVSPLPGSGRLLESSRWAASRRGARPPVSATARGAVVHQSSENAGAQDVSRYDSLAGRSVREADNTLVLDLATLGITLDNVEGLAFGPVLPDGRRSLVLVSDDNFSDSQKTQVLLFALDR